jgi:uncharacterized protein (DUF1800 family)
MPKPILAPARWRAVRLICLVCGMTLASAASAQLSHGPDPLFHDGFAGVTAGPFNDSDAARFLAQATFGPTDADIAHLRAVGYQAWLNEQFTAPPSYEMTYMNWVTAPRPSGLGEQGGQENRQEAWLLGALGGPDPQNNTTIHTDQLRQRVAFALSEIFVVSDQNTTLGQFAGGMTYYYDILVQNAFGTYPIGNYRTLLEKVTLSPAMGVYLNMMGNRRADLANNVHPDENYGREINQLFSVGLVMLNLDGTPQLDVSGKPIPTYSQATISNFAHVFTGWNWSDCDSNGYDNFAGQYPCGPDYQTGADFTTPMVAYETKPPNENDPNFNYNYHDNGTHADDVHNKQLLAYPQAVNGGLLADGGTAANDLKFALDNIFNHPNIAPFISKQLIQRLVTSNPSPAYVSRVATVFNNNGSSVRGDLKAVVQAILLDPEARYGQWRNADTFGKLREPLITLTHFWRAMHAVHMCGQDVPYVQDVSNAAYYQNQPYRYAGYQTGWNTNGTTYGGVAQKSLDANTVFNFFKPGYLPNGEMAARSPALVGPEFQMQTDSVIAHINNSYAGLALYSDFDTSEVCNNDPQNGDFIGEVKINHSQDLALAATGNGTGADTADRLVDAYNKRFMSGQMSPFMRQNLLTYLNSLNSSSYHDAGTDWRLLRTSNALYMILTSPEYMIQK